MNYSGFFDDILTKLQKYSQTNNSLKINCPKKTKQAKNGLVILLLIISFIILKPLSAKVVHTRHDADVSYSGCSLVATGKIIKNGLNVFEKGENLL